jgi:branched-chain amino acid transport system substrate-binding protein
MSAHATFGSRRSTARGCAILAALAMGTLGLAACGSSTSTVPGTGSSAHAAAPSGAGASVLTQVFGAGGASAGQGKNVNVGAALVLSGANQLYGKLVTNGAQLAADQIAAAGGPTFKFDFKDILSAVSPATSAGIAQQFCSDGIRVVITQASFGLGGGLPEAKQCQMFTLDGSGGTSIAFRGLPYFWGARAETPVGPVNGILKYLSIKAPTIKRLVVVGYDEGSALNSAVKSAVTQAGHRYGMTVVGDETFTAGTTDFSNVISRVNSDNPDALLLNIYGADLGNFVKQYVQLGGQAQTIGFDYTPDAVSVAGSAYNDFMFGFDYFDPASATSNWGKYFVSSYQAKYGSAPDYYAANGYEDMFILWSLMKDAIAAGKSPSDGSALETAMEAKPVFPSVYGGSGSTPGTISFDTSTHSVKSRELAFAEQENGSPVVLATFNNDGSGFTVVAAPQLRGK